MHALRAPQPRCTPGQRHGPVSAPWHKVTSCSRAPGNGQVLWYQSGVPFVAGVVTARPAQATGSDSVTPPCTGASSRAMTRPTPLQISRLPGLQYMHQPCGPRLSRCRVEHQTLLVPAAHSRSWDGVDGGVSPRGPPATVVPLDPQSAREESFREYPNHNPQHRPIARAHSQTIPVPVLTVHPPRPPPWVRLPVGGPAPS